MSKFKITTLLIFIFAIPFILSGCVTLGPKQGNPTIDGGVFKSVNKGTAWQQKASIASAGGAKNFVGLNIASMALDPNDRNAIYYGSVDNGLLYSYDGGEGWQVAKALGQGTVRAVAVDPKSKCTIYASIGNKVYKSIDCNRTWTTVYFDNDLTATINEIIVDTYDSSIVYIGISRGDIVKSSDKGESWQTIFRTKESLQKLVEDPNDSRVLYAMDRRNVYRSVDSGKNWEEAKEITTFLKETQLGADIKDFSIVKGEGTIFLATYYGLSKSNDKGATWEKMNLITPEKKATINAIAINQKNSKEIYYVTNTTFYRSLDGGQNWSTIKLPTTRAGWSIKIDQEDPNIIYLGVRAVK